MSVPNAFYDGSNEQDERWTAVDAYALEHLHPPSRPNHETLVNTLKRSDANGLDNIAAHPTMAKYLALQCRIAKVEHALEVGTLGGYTAIWIASENPKLHLTSIECDTHSAKVARENIEKAGLTDRIEVVEGVALEVLPKLVADVKASKRAPYGFAFIDADKQNNWPYVQNILKMSQSGTIIVVDNVVRRAELVLPQFQHDTRVIGSRQVVEEIGKLENVDATLIQTVSEKDYDGFLLAVVQ
ncbi:O-methyltransferase [Patellaria atrata CBS 101060]|uniref:O-methyltransferase n=1 Tax=Patellaria atrata CBS 101060 TaxID=1346257 RepID=A0A9P4VPL0_9PEZI|nr:O-methyltransferase [Patellaria atrata CBS 101060]